MFVRFNFIEKIIMKIFITRKIPEVGIKMLKDKGYEVDVYSKDKIPSQNELIKLLKKKPYNAVLTLLTDKIDSKLLDAVPNAKIISNYAVGYDNLDIAEIAKRNMIATNTPGTSSDCVAEHTMALMLGLTTRMVEGDRFMRAGKYRGWEPMLLMGTDLKNKTLGLIGAGAIGERVAHQASRGFEMKIIYHDVVHNECVEKDYGAIYKNTVEEVLKEADIVTLHVPLLESTHHLINAGHFKMMKPTAYLINTSRGPVVDENALVQALRKGVIRGAGLDVYEFEPKTAKGLTKLSNVILTPHIASSRDSARGDMSRIAAQNIIDVFEGRIPRGLIDGKHRVVCVPTEPVKTVA